ncbi:MAG: spermidine synthase [Frankiaceae bacterium]
MSSVAQRSDAALDGVAPGRGRARSRLVLASALMLFVELALIRWLGSNVLHLSYFSNFVLLGSFLGIGLGFLRAPHPRDLSRWWPVLLALLVAFVLAFPVQVNQNSDQILYFTGVRPTGLPPWVTLPLIFLVTAAVLAGLGETVGRMFPGFPALEAYRLDLLGSLAGTVAFSVLAFLHTPPLGWAVVVVAAYLVLHTRRTPRLVLPFLALLLGLLAVESFTPHLSWSPYYKIKTDAHDGQVDISVNGVPHQTVIDVSHGGGGLRQVPFARLAGGPIRSELIVGAGSGDDVAVGLGHGVGSIDAVEIDPGILAIGRAQHPNRPYADPRVSPHITDGRAFLQQATRKYDLIVFALPDSLTLVSGQSSLRLESYLFTREAIATARRHLSPHGAFAMYNSYREQWLVDRYAGTLQTVFGHRPCIDTVGGAGKRAALVVAVQAADQRCATTWAPTSRPVLAAATDDHPFPYLKARGIPTYYLLVLGAILLLALGAVRTVAGPLRRMRPYADLFFMGAAFLLLETKNVTGFALLFGTTWLVNALVFAGVLIAVLIAVEVSARVRTVPPPPVQYAALAATLALAWLVPTHALLGLPFPLRLVVATALAFAPIFCANVIFAARFRATGGSTAAFGANLLGAVLGGVLEYAALVVGYQALLILAGGIYLAAFLCTPRGGRAAA